MSVKAPVRSRQADGLVKDGSVEPLCDPQGVKPCVCIVERDERGIQKWEPFDIERFRILCLLTTDD